MRRLLVVLLVAAGVFAEASPAADAATPVHVQILAINDLHGRIDEPSGAESRLVVGPGPDGSFGRDEAGESDDVVTRVGGVMNLATTVQGLQREFRGVNGGSAASFLVGAGDLVGASRPPSGDYRDEPTIEALNVLGMDVSVVGDDELGLGTTELRRLSAATDGQFTDDVTACQGVTPGSDGCFGEGEHAFTGAQYPYLAANVVSRRTGEPMLPPYQVFFTPEGVKVGLVGVVTRTPRNLPAESVPDVQIVDEAQAVNRSVAELRRQGVETIGVLMHDGGVTTGPTAPDPNGCDQLEGAVTDLNAQIDPAVDLLVTGHTHGAYVCRLPVPGGEPRLVTQAGAHGRLVTDIRLTVDPATGDVDRAATYSAVNVPVERGEPDPRLQALVDYWTAGPGNEAGDEEPAAMYTTAAADRSADPHSATLGIAVLASVGVMVAGALGVRRRLLRR